jgi:hypothetical protein
LSSFSPVYRTVDDQVFVDKNASFAVRIAKKNHKVGNGMGLVREISRTKGDAGETTPGVAMAGCAQ